MKDDIDALTEKIELTQFLTPHQITKIIEEAVKIGIANGNSSGAYQAKVEISTLLDAIGGLNKDMEILGTEWVCPDCSRPWIGRNTCVCGYIIKGVLPGGNYTLLKMIDLGAVTGTCGNYQCGHPIRYEFHIKHIETGAKHVLGSVCVQNFLGNHDLINVALSLMARLKTPLDKQNKSQKAWDICGHIIERLRKIDPKQVYTFHEQKYGEKIQQRKSGITLKKAKQLVDEWSTENDFEELFRKVEMYNIDIVKKAKDQEKERKKFQFKWKSLLLFKKWDNRGGSSDFIQNCLDELEETGTLSTGKQNALYDDYELYWNIRKGDLSGHPINKEMEWLLSHAKKCRGYFFISLAIKLFKYGSLSDGQIGAMKKGCMQCGMRYTE